ncbi:MAG: C1 family peptidase [Elusimicrobiota bacterium]
MTRIHSSATISFYTSGKKLGGHAVLLVGNNDAEQYFIIKNNWDKGWGES